MTIKQNIKNGLLTAAGLPRKADNQPAQYADRAKRYFADETKAFVQEYAQYSSDFFVGEAQGLLPDAPQEWVKVRMRMADVVRPSAVVTRRYDDYKYILLEPAYYDYVRPGTKFKAMGCYWLMINPRNISVYGAGGIVRRCNAVWNYLDYYGNVQSEPMVVENFMANANDSDSQESVMITKGYYNVAMQYNEVTAQLDTNSRMILGSGAYYLTGYGDFLQEFTGDYSSVRLLEFSLRYEEPNYTIDDMVNHVAGGKLFSWNIAVNGKPTVAVGDSVTLTASSMRNGSTVVSTEENPVSYVWSSSDESIATVDDFGQVLGVSEGDATIYCQLAQNPEKTAEFSLSVASPEASYIAFADAATDELNAYSSMTVSAAYYENGVQQSDTLAWDFSGAEQGSYTAEVDGNSVLIKCWGGSVKPLTITASFGEYSESITLNLLGM